MVSVPSPDAIYDFVANNQNTTNWAVVFHETTTPFRNIQYHIWYNSSRTSDDDDIYSLQLLSLMRGLDEAIIAVLNDPNAQVSSNLDAIIKDWPVIPPTVLSDTIVQNLGPVFFFCAVMVIFINTLDTVIHEKEKKLRYGMEVMGLRPSVYWSSHFISASLESLIASVTTTCLGLALNFQSFRNSNFMVPFIYLGFGDYLFLVG